MKRSTMCFRVEAVHSLSYSRKVGPASANRAFYGEADAQRFVCVSVQRHGVAARDVPVVTATTVQEMGPPVLSSL